jgi:glycosyltransferase involved in cell wall biosynthesis
VSRDRAEAGRGTPLRIGFLGDTESPNSRSWIEGLCSQPDVEVSEGPRFETFGRAMSPLRIAGDLRRLRRWLKSERLDVLIGYRTTSYGFVAALTGFHPLVLATQGETDVWPPGGLRTRVKERTARYAVRRADLLHAWGPHMAEELARLGADRRNILIMPRGIDVSQFRPADRCRRRDRLVIASTRALYCEYHVETVVKGVAIAAQRSVPVELRIAGNGVEREALEKLGIELGLGDNIRFLGRIPSDAVASLLREAEVFASTPETEGVSASLLEAMASGCIPVVTDLPGNRDWVRHGDNGFLVQESDSIGVARALEEIWSDRARWQVRARGNVEDIRMRADRSVNAKRFVAEYRRLAAAGGVR